MDVEKVSGLMHAVSRCDQAGEGSEIGAPWMSREHKDVGQSNKDHARAVAGTNTAR
jgi:hypothetical protein